METAIGQSDLLQALGWAVFNSLWQMAILWVAYQCITFVFRFRHSFQRNTLAVFLLFSGFAWFIYTFVTGLVDTTVTGKSLVFMNVNGNSLLNKWLTAALPTASVIYLILLLLPVLNLIRNYRYVQVIRRYGLSRADAQWRLFVQKTAAQMGIRKPVHIWMSDLVSSPVTIGYLKPIILLPIAAVNHLSTQQTEAVLLHELSHIRRYDYFINLLVKSIQAILYFNPFVKAFTRIIEREREKSCDETVMQFQYEPHGYASALLVLEKAAHVPKHSLTVAASDGKKGEFRQRIEWIMGIRAKKVFSFHKLAAVAAAILCFIGLNALLIMNKPTGTMAKNSFGPLDSPYEFFASNNDELPGQPVQNLAENKKPAIVNNPVSTEKPANATTTEETTAPSTEESQPSLYHFVNNLETVIPKLNSDEEKQVQVAIQESKKVIQEIQWKEVEKTIADAMTSLEKEKVKEVYKKEINKADWNLIGDKLRIAYDNIDWKTVNSQLDYALASIRLDSLESAYTIALTNLGQLQKELVKENQPGIPDTDLTVTSIETRKEEVLKAIIKVRSARPRKIIRL